MDMTKRTSTIRPFRTLSVAAGYGKIGCVLLIGTELKDWRMSRKASTSPALAAQKTREWMRLLDAETVVTEKLDRNTRKGKNTIRIIRMIARIAEQADATDVAVVRVRRFKSKYDEAAALIKRFPQIAPFLPPRRKPWQAEPRNMIYFEALSMALEVIDRED